MSGSSGHRSQMSTGGGGGAGGYQMQPHISLPPQSPRSGGSGSGSGYSTNASLRREYDPPQLANTSQPRAYLPAYPPPAATTSGQNAVVGGGVFDFDGFDAHNRGGEASMGMMYTPLQPSQVYGGAGGAMGVGGHSSRSSFSGPYGVGVGAGPQSNNPFGPGLNQGQGQGQIQGQGQGQGGQESPRYNRRSQGYGA